MSVIIIILIILPYFYRDSDKRFVKEMAVRKAFGCALSAQLYTKLFNKVNSWFVEAVKIICIGAAIINGYAGIRF